MAFAPTPALEHNTFSAFNGVHRHASIDTYTDAMTKEVRFEEPELALPSSLYGRHSIATSNVPLLPPVASASHIPKQSFRLMNPPSQNVDITAYFEQCRNVNEQLRQTHEQERRAWEIERTALKTRIADLEFKLNKASGGRRRLSNDSHHFNVRPFPADFFVHPIPGTNGYPHRHHSISNAALDHLKQDHGKPVWEPESSLPVARVFSHDDTDAQHLPSISENGPAPDSTSSSLSPQTSHEIKPNIPIPIQEIDSALDGITVKSEGVRSSFHKVMSPIIIASPMRSPSPSRGAVSDPPRLQLDTSALLDPLDAKLKKNAGHTPLAFDGTLSSTNTTIGGATPLAEKPPAPAPTARPPLRPSENSNSYFSTNDLHADSQTDGANDETAVEDTVVEQEPILDPGEEDRALTGPLMLDKTGQSEASHVFLDKLDEMLGEVVRRSQNVSPNRSPDGRHEEQRQQPAKTPDDDMPRLRLKKSTNFGSAYGAREPGAFDR